MDGVDTLTLLGKIQGTWDAGRWPQAKHDIWRESLTPLDYGTACTAYVRLRGTHPNLPSVAEFIAQTKALNTHDAGNPATECVNCDGTGWILVDAPHYHTPNCTRPAPVEKLSKSGKPFTTWPCQCHAATACTHCAEGDTHHQWLQRHFGRGR